MYSMLAILHPALLFRERDRRATACGAVFTPSTIEPVLK
jgi:hypothetical protein